MVPAWFIYKEDVYYQFEGKYFKPQSQVKSISVFKGSRLSENLYNVLN